MALKAGNSPASIPMTMAKPTAAAESHMGIVEPEKYVTAHAHEPGTEKFIDQAGNAVA